MSPLPAEEVRVVHDHLFSYLIVGLSKFINATSSQYSYPYPPELQHAMNFLALKMGNRYPETLPSLLALLHTPIDSWLPKQIDLPEGLYREFPILSNNDFHEITSEFLEDNALNGTIGFESIGHARDNALVKRWIEQVRNDYAQAEDDNLARRIANDYAQARYTIIEHPIGSRTSIKKQLITNSYIDRIMGFYEPTFEAQHRLAGNETTGYKVCGQCGPIRRYPDGHTNSLKPQTCQGRCPFSDNWTTIQDDNLLVLKRGIQLRVMIPGRAEIDLYHQLYNVERKQPRRRRIREVELYPAVDAYDIRITLANGHVLAVDVKDYQDAVALGIKIRESGLTLPNHYSELRWDDAFFIIPEYHERAQPGYRDQALRQIGELPEHVHLMTDKQFLNELTEFLGTI